ncbi:hypothetical protein N7536_001851 [Penicillium majusculum]|uniref:Uncharacterized protein n=1 Tax=Penicillium solitum TaxID=60172 RepID=A0A1V6QXH3_9EURO|nr:uncharacterized protein PENSOL_c029G07704 [Penicillium solitum]KAJ5706162.1 hypothetical protein N7536_001851 [Penicillium majusculum]OQD93888.1 hypothetical protein PENSOL_c029G07704 [Penicillium solitum]
MDQHIEETTRPIEEVPNEPPNEPLNELLKEASIPINDMQVKAETEGQATSPAKSPNLEVSIISVKPNAEFRRVLLSSNKVHNNEDPESNDLPNDPEQESLDQTDSKKGSGDEHASDEDYKYTSGDESDCDEEQPSGDDGSEFDPNESSAKPTKKGRSKERQKKAKIPLTMNEKVKSLMNSDILSAANANANASDMHQIPVSQKKDKSKALAEEISKLSIEDQPQAKKDANALIEYSKRFTPSAKIVDMNWQVGGLNTLLKHHQLKAAAWMHDRESSNEEPNGGLLCDEMGLGKTLTVLATIAHEKIPRRSHAPTLLVVPRSLIGQWINQIHAHCVSKISDSVFEYCAGSQSSQSVIVKIMKAKRIVITTYEQICSSYPKLKMPVTIESPEDQEAWREEEFNRRAGPFHKVEWHRIVLDEAHAIKNKDSATSIAVRALKGKFKWAMSGTPLHNGAEELYPYLHFIFTSERMEYETFLKKYSNGLDNILETVLHRSTYSTRMLGKPIVTLPGFNSRVVEVDFCAAERLLYRELQDLGIAMIEGTADTKQTQSRCIFAVITMLRMFVSHPLLIQNSLKTILNKGVIQELQYMAQKEGVTETTSGIIIDLILALANKIASRPRLPGNFSELRDIYHETIIHVRQHEGRYQEFLRRQCPRCEEFVTEDKAFVVTSCQHLYCKGCFDQLPDPDGKIDTITRVCSSCQIPIEEAGYSDDSPEKSPKKGTPKKRKQSKPKPKGKKIFDNRTPKVFKEKYLRKDRSDDDWDEPSDDEDDWISRVGDSMPSAKTTAVRELVTNWVKEDEDVKIVIFVQFLKTVRLLQYMCEEEGWKYAVITGRVSPISRDKQIEQFGKEKDIKIMISSLKTGGVGLNLTMANKCILVDPWWNEAIQDQAYCRLYRIGQPRVVESVQVVAKGSIDDYMVELQKRKTRNIRQVFGADALKEILGLSGEIREKPNGGFSIFNNKGNKHANSWVRVIDSGILKEAESSEED